MLSLENIEFRAGRFALSVNARMAGPITGLHGPSGAGKTTLLELIAGLRRPAAGKICFGETVLTDAAARVFVPPERRRVGYVPQDLALFPHRTVRGNLLYGFRPGSDPKLFDRVVEVLELRPLLERETGNLSGGEKQRVAVGRALVSSPALLLLDEPLSSLNAALTRRLLELLKATAVEFRTPMLYVTHDAGELAALGGEVILMAAGRIAGQGPFRELFEASETPLYVVKNTRN